MRMNLFNIALHLNEMKCRYRFLILNATEIALVVIVDIRKFVVIVISDNR